MGGVSLFGGVDLFSGAAPDSPAQSKARSRSNSAATRAAAATSGKGDDMFAAQTVTEAPAAKTVDPFAGMMVSLNLLLCVYVGCLCAFV